MANAELWLPVAPLAKHVREALSRPESASGGMEQDLQVRLWHLNKFKRGLSREVVCYID